LHSTAKAGRSPRRIATVRPFNARTNITNRSSDSARRRNYNPRTVHVVNSRHARLASTKHYRLDHKNSAGGTPAAPGRHHGERLAQPIATAGFTIQKTWGVFVEECAALRARLLPHRRGSSVREQRVRNRSFPARVLSEVQLVVVSPTGFLPDNFITTGSANLQLRSAHGAIGRASWPNDALRTFTATRQHQDTDRRSRPSKPSATTA